MTTERRQEYIRAIDGYFRRNDQLPSCPKLAELMGTTPNAAFEMYTKLERAGIVSRNDQGKFKRGPRWPQEDSCDRREHDAQTHPVAMEQFETCLNQELKANSSWPPCTWYRTTPEGAISDYTKSTSRRASDPEASWYSRIPSR